MNLFNQIVPRFNRAITRRGAERRESASESEFTVKPAYELKETDEAWGLVVHLPGVAKEDLEITAEEGRVLVRGRRNWQKPTEWTAVYRESADAPYELELEHDNTIEVDKIVAELKDGVLRVSLPKAEAVKPRKIAVN
jgi:HSP20 family protein